MMETNRWLRKIGRLRVDVASGDPAPHKPLLLLVLLDLAEDGLITNARLELTPEIAFRFLTYWRIVAHRRRQRGDVRYPFYHLGNDGFWHTLREDGEPSTTRRDTRFAEIDPSFREFISSKECRDEVRAMIASLYFRPEERVALHAMLDLPIGEDATLPDLDTDATEAAQRTGRDVRFRLTVVTAYNYTCALTRYRLTTISGSSVVDAAHIHSFSHSKNDDPRNGIALCKNAHWSFDNGLWTLNDDYSIEVAAEQFDESSVGGNGLLQLRGSRILLPCDRRYWPSPEHLAWHRSNVFRPR